MKLSRNFYREQDVAGLFGSRFKTNPLNYEVILPREDYIIREKLNGLLVFEQEHLSCRSAEGENDIKSLEDALPGLNCYRSHELPDGNFFVSTDTGDWTVLSRSDFSQLKVSRFSGTLKNKLEKNFILLTDKNINRYIRKLKIRYGFLAEGPTLHIVVVTSRCNLRCIYCQASAGVKPQEDMTRKAAAEVVKRIFESPSDSFIIEFQGGEPLLNFTVIKSIVEDAGRRAGDENKRVEYSLISNFTGTATEKKLAWLLKNDVSVCFSLDGPEELHVGNRCGNLPDGFQILKDKVNLYKKIWGASRKDPPILKALMTVTRPSLPLFREIVDTYLDFGITDLSVRALTPLGKAGERNRALEYTPEEFLEFWKNIVTYIIKLRQNGIQINEFYLELILTKLFGNESGYMDMRSPCGAGYGQILYNTDGKIYTCDEGRMIDSDYFAIGNIAGEHLNNVLKTEKAKEVFGASFLEQFYCDYCAFKPYCGICPVLMHQEKGTLYGNVLDTFRCKVTSGMVEFVLDLLLTDTAAREEFEKILLDVNWQKME
jgi:uncharacterized protein